jgi:hypothetical protein
VQGAHVSQNMQELVSTIRKLTASERIENEWRTHGKDGFCGSIHSRGERRAA